MADLQEMMGMAQKASIKEQTAEKTLRYSVRKS
jgi:hypothetical protein